MFKEALGMEGVTQYVWGPLVTEAKHSSIYIHLLELQPTNPVQGQLVYLIALNAELEQFGINPHIEPHNYCYWTRSWSTLHC